MDSVGPALLTGLGFGALLVAQVGPMWIFCARTSARNGFVAGAAVGAGIAVVDVIYAILGLLGAGALVQATGVLMAIGLVGAAVLVWIGLRTLHDAFRIRVGVDGPADTASPLSAVRTAFLATLSNPQTILTWAALFSGAAAAGVASGPEEAAALVLGVAIGSLGGHLLLAGFWSVAGARMGPRALRTMDLVSGAGVLLFGLLLGWRTIHAQEATPT